jgi:SAM-dependent methyltransferase
MPLTSDARILYEHCPLCEHTSIDVIKNAPCAGHPLYHVDIPPLMTWMKCAKCAHVFTNGYFTDEACKLIFSKTHDNQSIGQKLEVNRAVSARMIEKVLPYQSSGMWMDIGVGNGSLLFTAEEYGFEVVGVDLRSSTIDTLRTFGFVGHCIDFQQFDKPGAFNVISMADVLEHMPFPVQALKHVHSLLADGGVTLISLPNSENLLWRLLDKNNTNPYWGEIEHYHNFSRTRLFQLLSDTGFQPLRYGISERYRVCMEVLAVKK